MRRVASVVVAAALLPFMQLSPAQAETLHTAFTADTGTNGTRTYDAAAGAYSAVVTTASGMRVYGGPSAAESTAIYLGVSMPAGVTLAPGSFLLATDPPTNGYARFTDNICHAETGHLRIDAMTRSSTGTITSLSASYVLNCASAPAAYGDIRYRSPDPWRSVGIAPPDLADAKVGTSARRELSITASGASAVQVGQLTSSAPEFRLADDGCSGTLVAAGSACTVAVVFTPTAAGPAGATLRVPVDTRRGRTEVALTGHGYTAPPPPSLRVQSGVDGARLQFAAAADKGGSTITVLRVYRSIGEEPFAPLADVAASAVRYIDPLSPGTAARYAMSTVTSGWGEGPLGAESAALIPTQTPAPGALNLVASDTAAGDGASALTSTSSASAGYGDLSFNGPAGSVLITASDGFVPWAPGRYPDVRISVSEGLGWCYDVTTVDVHAAAMKADGTPLVYSMTAPVVCGGSPGRVEVRLNADEDVLAPDTTPERLVFAPQSPGTSSAPQRMSVTNEGTLPLRLGTAAVTDPRWKLSDDTCSGIELGPTSTCSVDVSFVSDEPGVFTAALEIPDDSPIGRRRVALSSATESAPSAPTGLTVDAQLDLVTLRWQPPHPVNPYVSSYAVYRGLSPTAMTRVGLVNVTSFRDNRRAPGARIYYAVAAVNDKGEGPRALIDTLIPQRELHYTADVDGTGVYRLHRRLLPGGDATRFTSDTADEEDPALSPDRKRLAYTKFVGADRHLYVATIGSRAAPELLLGGAWQYADPSWSPDGRSLAYGCRPTAQARWDICVWRDATRQSTRVPNGTYATGPSWLPNGRELLVISHEEIPVVAVLAVDGAYRVPVTGTAGAFSVEASPDGSRVAFSRFDGPPAPGTEAPRQATLHVIGYGGGARVALTTSGYANDPSWSADSSTIYFTHAPATSTGLHGNRDVLSVRALGGRPVNLTSTPDVDEDDPIVSDPAAVRAVPYISRPMADFNGDGKADIAVFRPSTGTWHIRGRAAVVHGRAGDIPVPGDYNGNGRDEIAVYRPSTGTWYISGRAPITWGRPGDIPVPGDYNGDGRTDLATFRPSTSTSSWHVYGRQGVVFGKFGELPVPADYDRNGTTDIATYGRGRWFFLGKTSKSWGSEGVSVDPVPADYTGDGRADAAYYDRKGSFFVYPVMQPWVKVPSPYAAELPLIGNFNGDRRADPGVFLPVSGVWRVLGQPNVRYGQLGDVPV